jgi:Ca2+-binding EF-hand superfamily protein
MGSLSPADIQLFLSDFQIFCTQGEAYNLIRQYDSNQNGRLAYNEFLQLVLPSTNPSFRELALSRRGIFTSEVEYLLVKLIQQEVMFHRSLEIIRRELVSRSDFNLLEAFKLLNVSCESSLTRIGISQFMARFKNFTEQDIDALFRRLDNDGDSVLSYLEFVDAVMPSKRVENVEISGNVRSASPLRLSPKREPFRDLPNSSYSPLRQSPGKRHASPLRKSPNKMETSEVTRVAAYQSTFPAYSSTLEAHPRFSPGKTVSFTNSSNFNYREPRNIVNGSHSGSFNRNETLTPKTFQYQGERSSPLRQSPNKTSSVRERTEVPLAELREVVSIMQEEIKSSHSLDSIRNNLALKHDFNLIDAFRMFDLQDNGFITLMDVENCLARFGLRPSQDEIYLLIRHYSRLQDSRLRFSDFSEMLTSKQEEYARIMRNKQAINIPGLDRFKVFARDTIIVFISAFNALFEAEIRAEQQRQRIKRLPGFNLYQVFNVIDKDKNGFITVNEIQKTMEDCIGNVNPRDLMVVMQKFDKNNDGRVSYSEFIDEITPKSSQLY